MYTFLEDNCIRTGEKRENKWKKVLSSMKEQIDHLNPVEEGQKNSRRTDVLYVQDGKRTNYVWK